MDKKYLIQRLPSGCTRMPLEGEFHPEGIPAPWNALSEACLDQFPWFDLDSDYTPACSARVGWNEEGIHVLMYANEPVIRAVETQTGGDIYLDSCQEFFLSPVEGTLKYVNCEVNALAIMHIGIGESRYDRRVYSCIPDGFNPVHSLHCGAWWAVSYTLPTAFLQENFGFTPRSGAKMKGNFFKCGDRELRNHHGMYHAFSCEKPDHHRPELFADMELE